MSLNRPDKKSVEVILAGGLGNQLFQLARALHLAKSEKVHLNVSHLKTNSYAKREPDILDFNLGNNVQACEDVRSKKVKKRLINLGIRLSSLQISTAKSYAFIKKLNFVLFLLHSLKIVKKNYFVSSGIGFTELDPIVNNEVCLIGYFQSYKWLESESTKAFFDKLALNSDFELYKKYHARAIDVKPLVVHVRMGDYLAETKFGIPSTKYFEKSILELWSTDEHKEIWLFSENPSLAKSHIPKILLEKCVVIEDLNLSASQTLELMRLGSGYVISNSTFSWWGAFLAHQPDVKVIYPQPWFVNIDDPRELCPKDWLPRSRIG